MPPETGATDPLGSAAASLAASGSEPPDEEDLGFERPTVGVSPDMVYFATRDRLESILELIPTRHGIWRRIPLVEAWLRRAARAAADRSG